METTLLYSIVWGGKVSDYGVTHWFVMTLLLQTCDDMNSQRLKC